MHFKDNIIALATPSGAGAIAIIRLSGEEVISIANESFNSVTGKNLIEQKSHTIHLGHIIDDGKTYDEVLVSIFKNPHSYTGENVIEISCHGSSFIQQEIIQLFLQNGCRMADNGEFTMRAFLNGKMDLSQAEAVADVIASNSAASHQMAIQQMRGGITNELNDLRAKLLEFWALIEFELDSLGIYIPNKYEEIYGFEKVKDSQKGKFKVKLQTCLRTARENGLILSDALKPQSFLKWENKKTDNFFKGKFRYYVILKTKTIEKLTSILITGRQIKTHVLSVTVRKLFVLV